MTPNQNDDPGTVTQDPPRGRHGAPRPDATGGAPSTHPQAVGHGTPDTAPPIALRYHPAANFGDALSPMLVQHLSGRRVKNSGPQTCDIVALGSIIDNFSRHYAEPSRRRPYIWGTGFMKPHSGRFRDNVEVCAVRGPLTGTLLGLGPDFTYGDPGLLVDELLDAPPERTDTIGIIAHHAKADQPELQQALDHLPHLKLIEVRSRDALDVVRQIGSCRFILSSSLHGLIVADSLGVPNHWLDVQGIHYYPEFKFYDYALGVGRELGQSVKLEALEDFLSEPLPATIPYADGVARSRERLRAAFPAELVAAA